MESKNIIIILILAFTFTAGSFAQDVSVVLKNSKVVVGRIIEEKPDYVLVDYQLGQLKIDRNNIQSIAYNPFWGPDSSVKGSDNQKDFSRLQKFSLKDPVVVYLKNGNVVAGLLLAKSLNMVMLQTESGNLAIPKRELDRIEYISGEYAERGEIVIAYLNNGQRFEGNIYFEDSNELALDTEIGRLTLPKNKLRTIEYTGRTGVGELTIADQYSSIAVNKRYIEPRYDIFSLSYSPKLDDSYGPGFGLGYLSRFKVAEFEGMHLSATGSLGLNYFTLNSDNIIQSNPSLNANLKGGAFIATVGAGAQINVYPQTASFYDFYISPVLEGHYIYKKLEQTYTSFPQFNQSESTSEFKFGLGVKFGMEVLFDSFRLGLDYNFHTIFGSDGFNQFSLTFVKPIF